MELTRRAYRFAHVNGIVLMVVFFSIGFGLLVQMIVSDTPEEAAAALFVGSLFTLVGAIMVWLHWMLYIGVRDKAIRIIEQEA